MSAQQPNLLANPLFKYGMGVASATIVVAVAFLFVEDQTVRLVMFAVAALDLLVTPWVLGRAAEQAETDAGAQDL